MEFINEPNRIYQTDKSGNILAEVTFPATFEDTVNINHTFVHDSLRGQGVAGQLMLAAYKHIKSNNKKVIPTCSYAVAWFKRHPEYQDVLSR